MKRASLTAAKVIAATTVALALLIVSSNNAHAQWGFYYNPQNNTAGWNVGPYSTNYAWGQGWFRSNGSSPGGINGSYYTGPGYTGWSHWGPNHNHGAGRLQVPWVNNGDPVIWSY